MGVEWQPREPPQIADDHRPVGQIGDEVPVHHVEMVQLRPAGFEQFHLAVQVAEVAFEH